MCVMEMAVLVLRPDHLIGPCAAQMGLCVESSLVKAAQVWTHHHPSVQTRDGLSSSWAIWIGHGLPLRGLQRDL